MRSNNPGRRTLLPVCVLLLVSLAAVLSCSSGRSADRSRSGALLLSGIAVRGGSENAGRTFADGVKAAGASGAAVVAGSALFSEESDPVAQSLLADYFGLEISLWSCLYLEAPYSADAAALLAPVLDGRTAEQNRLNILAFVHRDGRMVVLNEGEHFSGKIPTLRLDGNSAKLRGWFPLNRARASLEGVLEPTGEGAVDFGLTDAGFALLSGSGIDPSVPAAVSRNTPFSQTVAFNFDISRVPERLPPEGAFFDALFRLPLFQRAESGDSLYWNAFVPRMRRLAGESSGKAASAQAVSARPAGAASSSATAIASVEPVPGVFRAEGKHLYRLGADGGMRPLPVRGVNLGAALPGTWFTEFPESENLYYQWFSMMRSMHIDTVRVYTLFPPAFYRTLRAWNLANPDAELLLLQEIWPEEHPRGNDYLDPAYDAAFAAEIELTIDALHGKRSVPFRKYRSWGEYASDVSPWLLGWLIGRELEPDEVLATDRLHPDFVWQGDYVSCTEGSPTEAWLAYCLDRAASYEKSRWGVQRPLSVVNWPTLDPLKHEVEWRDPDLAGRAPFNDKAVVDIEHIDVEKGFDAGLFGSYHIYPNYPDFIINTESYAEYRDEEGPLRFGGYLAAFMSTRKKYPSLVAEYGISTSLGIAHLEESGLHHGGHGEAEQGRLLVRLDRAIRREGYAGGIVFEWIDEWAKKTWTTEPFMVPYDRHALWHNLLDPEQNYGIVAMEAASVFAPVFAAGGGGTDSRASAGTGAEGRAAVQTMGAWGDEAGLVLFLEVSVPWQSLSGRLLVGIDTLGREESSIKGGTPGRGGLERGSTGFPAAAGGIPLPASDIPPASGFEFLLDLPLPVGRPMVGGRRSVDGTSTIEQPAGRVLAISSYNAGLFRFSPQANDPGGFLPVVQAVNRAWTDSSGRLRTARSAEANVLYAGEALAARTNIVVSENRLSVRIPWGMLLVGDPSSARALDDPALYRSLPDRDVLKTVGIEGIACKGLLLEEAVDENSGGNRSAASGPAAYRLADFFPSSDGRFTDEWTWRFREWNRPEWTMREKASAAALREYFGSLEPR